ncbi:MAG: hypothetical protein QNJ55_09910 [Xenococcus sp. MO_188.B8]|nr:hypothetical protein [Xenococcus sp. MO_188.B8]
MKVKYLAMLTMVSFLSLGVIACQQKVDTTSPDSQVQQENPCAGKDPCAGATK